MRFLSWAFTVRNGLPPSRTSSLEDISGNEDHWNDSPIKGFAGYRRHSDRVAILFANQHDENRESDFRLPTGAIIFKPVVTDESGPLPKSWNQYDFNGRPIYIIPLNS
ncbi:hypothetical protein [Stratiformator vulcanicus]|uniref:Uncharacterized protein n=1 Tax=Stratiformator vulcanicus TaxID=2527980 RepID=A0A517R7D3_9PLAN|nr:hypothetical protein [Stratiformator vulcanicus]QDT39798.1 hypothetical protein Pan189_42090 [Stratiformator vulcanicus]